MPGSDGTTERLLLAVSGLRKISEGYWSEGLDWSATVTLPRFHVCRTQTAQCTVNSRWFPVPARSVKAVMAERKGKLIPMNIDGATAVIYGELGFPPPLARGLFCLSRSVGILAHAWEQSSRSERNKGPMPRSFGYLYEGHGPR